MVTTRLSGMPFTVVQQLVGLLSAAELDQTLVRELLRRKDLPERWVQALRELVKSEMEQTASLFRRPETICNAFTWRWERLGWPHDRRQIDVLRQQMPRDYVSQADRVLVLDIWLGDLQTTFDALRAWNYDIHPGVREIFPLRSDAERMRLARPERYGESPSVRWVVVDMAANLNRKHGTMALNVRNAVDAAGLPVLSAMALHPLFPPALGTGVVPWVGMPGIITMNQGQRDGHGVPVVSWGKVYDEFMLGEMAADCAHHGYAKPTFRDLPAV